MRLKNAHYKVNRSSPKQTQFPVERLRLLVELARRITYCQSRKAHRLKGQVFDDLGKIEAYLLKDG